MTSSPDEKQTAYDTTFSQTYYADQMKLTLNPTPQGRAPSTVDSGEHWVIWLNNFAQGNRLVTESGKQTTVFIEFEAMPEMGQPLDLAVAPLQVSYESGGQVATYIAREISGTLTLETAAEGGFSAQIDAVFMNPIVGTGDRAIQGRYHLTKHPNYRFTSP